MRDTVIVVEDGLLRIPIKLRRELQIEPGDTFDVHIDKGGNLWLERAGNVFDILADHAVQDSRSGRTRNLRVISEEWGVDLD